MSFSCSRPFSLTIDPAGDMPLNSAIYVGGATDKIFGVRDQWVFQFNATTGMLEKTFKYVSDAIFAESSIVNIGASLYIGVWRTVSKPTTLSTADVYQVNLGLTTSTPLGLAALASVRPGFTNLTTDGTLIYGMAGPPSNAAATMNVPFKVDPTNVAATYKERTVSGFGYYGYPTSDSIFDVTPQVMWVVDGSGPEVVGIYYDFPSLLPVPASILAVPPAQLFGMTECPPSLLYCVMMNRTVLKVDTAPAVATLPANFSNGTATTLTNILAVGATPFKIKYNAHENLIYVPEWNNDTVQTLDAAGAVVSTQTGFNKPHDCVFQTISPFKKWAVQNSAVGLKEITI